MFFRSDFMIGSGVALDDDGNADDDVNVDEVDTSDVDTTMDDQLAGN